MRCPQVTCRIVAGREGPLLKIYDCLKVLSKSIDDKVITVTSLGGTAEEWSYLRGDELNFWGLNMGLCTPIATGMAIARPNVKVIALETDGSLLLEPGVLVVAAKSKPQNLVIVVFDNEVLGKHGPSFTADTVALDRLARASGIRRTYLVSSLADFRSTIRKVLTTNEMAFVLVKVEYGRENTNPSHHYKDGRIVKEEFVASFDKTFGSTRT